MSGGRLQSALCCLLLAAVVAGGIGAARLLGGTGVLTRAAKLAGEDSRVRLARALLDGGGTADFLSGYAAAALDSSLGGGYLPTLTPEQLTRIGVALAPCEVEAVQVGEEALLLTIACDNRQTAEAVAQALRETGIFALVELHLPTEGQPHPYTVRGVF